MSGEGHFYGSRKAFVCEHGFYLVGPRERVCQLNGTWSGVATKCRGKFQERMIAGVGVVTSCLRETDDRV